MVWLILLLLLDRLLSRWSKLFWSTDRMSSVQKHIVTRNWRVACLKNILPTWWKMVHFPSYREILKNEPKNRYSTKDLKICPQSNIYAFGLLINQSIWIKQKCSKFKISWCFIVLCRQEVSDWSTSYWIKSRIASLKLTWPGKESRWLP